MNFTCSADTATLRVEHGERDRLVAQQAQAHKALAAKALRK